MSSIERTTYWRSLDELADTPEFRAFVEKEFPVLSAEMAPPEVVNHATRRTFLKLMGASMALAGLTGCRWPRETIVEFAHRPEGFVPGQTVQYATAMDLGGAAVGLLATSYDGRPVKLEGNPLHPGSLGASSACAQAAVLELYDPDRSREPRERQGSGEFARTWEDFEVAAGPLFAAARAARGRGLRVLSRASSSPTLAGLRARLAEVMPQAGWHEYEAVSRDAERAGTALAFGRPLRPHYRLGAADVILALDDNFLADHPDQLRISREFAARRRADDGTMCRLWAIESAMTLTGANADERRAVPAQLVPAVAIRLAAALARHGVAAPYLSGLEGFASGGFEAPWIDDLAADLAAHRGRALVTAGLAQPAPIHALAHLLNAALGGVGATVVYTEDPDGARPTHAESIRRLAEDMKAGQVETLLVLGANPVYDAPAELDFAGALGRVGNTIHLGLHRDETGRACAWHLPQAHFLEAWSDARGWDGTVSVVQPLIAPLFGGRTPAEVVAFVLGEPVRGAHDLVRRAFSGGAPVDEEAWRTVLNRGVVENTAAAPVDAAPAGTPVAASIPTLGLDRVRVGDDALELRLVPDTKLYDGRFANNAWLQELPDPVTKVVWDNPLMVSPALARRLNLADGQLVTLTAGGRKIEAAVMLTPGTPAHTVVLALGYGRSGAGSVGNGAGFDAYRLRTLDAPWAMPVSLEATGRRYPLSTTQNHWAIEETGRKEAEERAHTLIRGGTLAAYKAKPDFAQHDQHEFQSLWKEHGYEGHAWGMAIDLSTCTGCGACTVACQAENNIPVVGKDQVARGREMHWIRVDRYFKGEPDDPELAFQPMACVHCENAPCEQVCPVGATLHNAEGLNQMVYNRCIGTRYCANNCPYKVRRFNYFNYNKDTSQLHMMQHNPDVTVRGRGVMEKCTFCVQRIENVKIQAKNEKRPIRDGEIVPACAQACPTQAIVFGDLNDKGSAVRKLHGSPRSYALLHELNTKPRLHYMARLKNPVKQEGGAGHGEHEHA